jgi:hypothetical protein
VSYNLEENTLKNIVWMKFFFSFSSSVSWVFPRIFLYQLQNSSSWSLQEKKYIEKKEGRNNEIKLWNYSKTFYDDNENEFRIFCLFLPPPKKKQETFFSHRKKENFHPKIFSWNFSEQQKILSSKIMKLWFVVIEIVFLLLIFLVILWWYFS